MSRQIVAVTGYFGTGSSAVLDLLKEYNTVHIVPETGVSYEHSVFFVPGGLFSLCSQLLHGNSPQTSDMVVNDFIRAMKRLNDNNFGWFGSYQKMFGDEFMSIVYRFVDRISTVRATTNSNHSIKVRFSIFKAAAQFFLHVFKGRKFNQYGTWYVQDRKPVYFSMPTEEELYVAAQEFTESYFSLFLPESGNGVFVFDHAIWPQQVDEFKKCFNDSIKVISVVRDPRDIYISDQYLWAKPHFSPKVNSFIDEWKRTVSRTSKDEMILTIHFEDLVYNYDEAIGRIEKFLGLSSQQHINKKNVFQPDHSIENTQVFLLKDEWKTIAQTISQAIPDLIYDFKEDRLPNKKLFFE